MTVMDEPFSFASSIFNFWGDVYHSTSLKELVHKVEEYSTQQDSSIDYLENDPNPYILFSFSLEKEMKDYAQNLSKCNTGVDEKLIHFNIIQKIDLLCEQYCLCLKNMTLLNYKRFVDYSLSIEKLNNGRVLIVWYLTNILMKNNQRGYEMKQYLAEKLNSYMI